MEKYPIFIDLNRQACLVVGGGIVALRKIRLQLQAGAKVTVIAPQLDDALVKEVGDAIIHVARPVKAKDIKNFRLITVATNDEKVNREVSRLAIAANVPVNVVDQPQLSSFHTPAIVNRSPILVAISTGGAAPVLARQLRAQIETLIPAGLGHFAAALRRTRQRITNKFTNALDRRRFWETVVSSSAGDHFKAGRLSAGEKILESLVHSVQPSNPVGEVSLVGAGPGDPDLLTFKALRLMQEADVVLYDRLVSKPILELCRRDADKIYVGKKSAEHVVPQGDINNLLLKLAQEGKRVVRLKGGDPFIFGRGGEELEQLHGAGIPFQVVPGITAASGCASYAGIPLTHRDHAQSVTFVTGHLKNGSVDLDWSTLATGNQTVVVYMGLTGLPVLCQQLINHGLPAVTPIALIEQGTNQNQRVFTGTLETLNEKLLNQNVHAPTLIIIGSVVSLQPKLAWRN